MSCASSIMQRLHRQSPTRRRGFVMLFVLSCVMIISLLAIGSIAVGRARLRTTSAVQGGAYARVDAQSAAEWAMHLLAQDPSGHALRRSSTLSLSGIGPEGGSWVLTLSDPADGDLRDSLAETMRARIVATNNRAVSPLQFDVAPTLAVMPSLEHAFVCTGTATLFVARILHGSSHTATTYHPSDVTWSSTTPLTFGGRTGLLVPDVSAINAWVALGTRIDIDSIPGATAEFRVLSPTLNPFGTANARGIYVIDCENKKLVLRNSRVVGTLIIINPGSGTELTDSVLVEAPDGQPALLVRGNIDCKLRSEDLDEAAHNTNFNPTGAPFFAATDTDRTDVYPSLFQGLVFIAGDANVTNLTVHGSLIIDGRLTGAGFLRVDHRDVGLIDGFTIASQLTIVPGSIQRK